MNQGKVISAAISRFENGCVQAQEDLLAVEEPLEVRVGFGPANHREQKSILITMRTPGNDFELVAGFLYNENIIQKPDDIHNIQHCTDTGRQINSKNIVRAELTESVELNLKQLERFFYTTSSCGVCGKASIEAVEASGCPAIPKSDFKISVSVIQTLAKQLLQKQAAFRHTGGLHAAALFDQNGRLQTIHEDVGRHNALDKLIGAAFYQGKMPLSDSLIVVSGRASFELVQKTLRAGVPVMVAVGAPSSLAVELAQTFGLTLIGFLRENRFNIYAGKERIEFK